MSSKLTKTRLYEVNLRFVYGLRCIGRGVEAGKTMCALLNLPQSPVKFKRYQETLLTWLSFVAEGSMTIAAHEATRENDGNFVIAAIFGGTWQKRGHTSLIV